MRAAVWTAAIAFVVMAAARTIQADAAHLRQDYGGQARGHVPEAPRLLSQTGLFVAGTTSVDPKNRRYSPQYPLWTDGAVKARWIRLPDGAVIEARDDDSWSFPVGTKLWKEFSFGGRHVETRFIWRAREDSWVFGSYVWNEDQTDATLAPAAGIRNVAEIGPGKHHSIPSLDDCHSCHEDDRVLGFTALQLSTDRDPLAPHAEPLGADMLTVKTLTDERRLRGARADLVSNPPRIQAATPTARAALGYLASNCGICHHDGAPIDTHLQLRTSPTQSIDDLVHLLRTAPTSWDLPSADAGATRFVTAGNPALSSIVARMKSRRPSSQMPPLGTTMVDQEALGLITKWIEELH